MNIKTALKYIVVLITFFTSVSFVFAQSSFEGSTSGVNLNANITQDLYSQLSINPNTVEVLEPTTVSLHLVDASNSPKANRTVVIYSPTASTGINITQPLPTDGGGLTSGTFSASNPGTYEICSKDITDGIDIYILDCETLYVVPVSVPSFLPEPQYTKGLSNTLTWTMSGSGTYTYDVQASTNSSFSTIAFDSGWISTKSYEFTNLKDTQIYFYRVKARNEYGAESQWSSQVYSVQDNSNPSLSLLSISGLGSTTTSNWNAQTVLVFKIRVKDNVGIQSKSFLCSLKDGTTNDCKESEEMSGDIWLVRVPLGNLEHDINYHLYTQYTFCAEAEDVVGNVIRVCNINLNIPETQVVNPKPVPQIIQDISQVVNQVLDSSKQIAQSTIGKINQSSLQQISMTVTIGNLLVGMGILLGGIGTLPYVLIQIFLAISSLLGFRKKGNATGYVYDSVTKEPLSQCIVRVFDESNALVWTDVTDREGYFRTNVLPAAEYSLTVTSKDHVFPSKIVFGRTDFPLENVYHGQEFYASKGQIPNFSIPLDRRDMGEAKAILGRFAFFSKTTWKILHIFLFLIGLVFSIYALSVNRVWFNYLILFLYIPSIMLLVFSLFGKNNRYGVVRNTSGKRISGLILGLKEKEYGQLVAKRVTDNDGRFRFLADKGVYELEVLSSDWTVVNTKDLENIKIKRSGLFVKNITVKKVVKEKPIKKVKVEEVIEPLEEL